MCRRCVSCVSKSIPFYFYHVSACCACSVRYCFSKYVRLCVSLSHCGIVSKRRHLSSDSFHHLVGQDPSFWPLCRYKIPRRTPSMGALYTRGGKNLWFSTKICLFWKRYNIRPWLLWITNRKSYAANRSMSVLPVTLRGGTWGVIFFWQFSVIARVWIDLEWRNFAL